MSACNRLFGVTMMRLTRAAGWWRSLAAARPVYQPRVGARSIGTSEDSAQVVTSPLPDIELPSGNLATYILSTASRWPERTAVECGSTGRSLTFAQLMDAVARWGGQLARMGVKKGDTVAVVMYNCLEYPVVVLGSVAVGVTVTVVNSTYTAEEVFHQLTDSGTSLVIHDEATEGVVVSAISLLKKPVKRIINAESSPAGVTNLRHILQDTSIPFADPVQVCGSDVAVVPYSSGTTGKAKGVLISHDALTANTSMFTHPSFFSGLVTTDSYQDTFLCYLPFYHVYGILPLMAVGLRSGIKLVSIPKFDGQNFVHQIAKHQVRLLHTVPAVLNFLINSPDVTPKSMASVDTLLCGAAPVAHSSAQSFKEKIDKPLFFQEGYGMTEVLISHATPNDCDRLQTCGVPLPNVKVKVIDRETGASLPANEPGEICFKTPSMMNGYLNNEAATQSTIDQDGWLHSGDIGFYDHDNFFKIVDRCKELIKVKALQVAPSDLEDVILRHPKVADVGVVGVPHDRLGEAPRAFVVASSSVTEQEIKEFVAARVAPFKQLAGGVTFISELPKNTTGKILKRVLKQMC